MIHGSVFPRPLCVCGQVFPPDEIEQVSNKDDMKTSLKKVVKEVGVKGRRGDFSPPVGWVVKPAPWKEAWLDTAGDSLPKNALEAALAQDGSAPWGGVGWGWAASGRLRQACISLWVPA